MPTVIKELAVSIGTYEDRQTGQTKNRYKNVGVIMEGESNGERYKFLLLDRSFNPAGIDAKPGSDKIIINLFDPKPRDGNSGSRDSGNGSYQEPQGAPAGGYDDAIPFAAEWRI